MSLSPLEYLRHIRDEIEWRVMAGMRDKLIHNYFGADYEIIWDVAANKVPVLQKQIETILKGE